MILNDAFSIIIEDLLLELKNEEIIKKLNSILDGIKDKKHVEEFSHPRHQSILLFGFNLFVFRDDEYIKMAEYLLANKRTIL